MNHLAALPDYIISFTSAIRQQIPAVEREALILIQTNCSDTRKIEDILDTLHSLHISGFMVRSQDALMAHLATLDPDLANWYKTEFEKDYVE